MVRQLTIVVDFYVQEVLIYQGRTGQDAQRIGLSALGRSYSKGFSYGKKLVETSKDDVYVPKN